MHAAATLLVLSPLLLLGCSEEGAPAGGSSTASLGSPSLRSSVLPGGGPPYLAVHWLSPEVYAGILEVGPSTIRLSLDIDDPLTVTGALEHELHYDWSVSYDVLGAGGGLGPHEFVVFGTARNGDLVLEHFDLDMPDGSHVFTDLTANPPVASIAGGGAYLPPSSRAAANPPVREELYRGTALGTDVLVTNDPEGRYTYVLSRDLEKLFVVPWDPTEGPLEYSLEGSPALLGLASSIGIQEHATEGRKLKVALRGPSGGPRFMLFSDYDGDGLFDGDVTLSSSDYTASGYPALWVNDFERYLSFMPPT